MNKVNKKELDKINNLVLFFSKEIKLHLGLKKLAKLFYFVDFTAFELEKKSITNLEYKAFPYGPMPTDFYKHLKRMEKEGLIKLKVSNEKYIPSSIQSLKEDIDLSVFSEVEKQIIEDIKEKFKYSTAREIELVAKNEPPYKMVKSREVIPYHLAFYRNSFDEMSLGNENSDS